MRVFCILSAYSLLSLGFIISFLLWFAGYCAWTYAAAFAAALFVVGVIMQAIGGVIEQGH